MHIATILTLVMGVMIVSTIGSAGWYAFSRK